MKVDMDTMRVTIDLVEYRELESDRMELKGLKRDIRSLVKKMKRPKKVRTKRKVR